MSVIRVRMGRFEVVTRLGTTSVVADLKTSLGLELYRYGHWDDVLEYVDTHLAPGDTFIDCGANVGLMSVVAAARVGPDGQVIAFEPNERTRAAFEKNIRCGGHANIAVLPCALGAQAGERPFVTFPNGGGLSSFAPASTTGGTWTKVAVRTLDDALSPDLIRSARLVKIDVEGAEVATLRGAQLLLSQSTCDFLLEVEAEHLGRQGASVDELLGMLDESTFVREYLAAPNVVFRRIRPRA